MLDKFRDHLIEAQLLKDEKFTRLGFLILGVVVVLLITDIIYLNSILITNRAVITTAPISPSKSVATQTPIPETPTVSSNYLASTLTPSPTAVRPSQELPNIAVKEYFIPLGTGFSQAGDWENIGGTQTTVDFSQYQNIKEIHFEASVLVPTANQSVSVRLFNQTDKHPVWFSDVTMNGNASAYLTSQPLAYDTGAKVYQVQMKTQLQSLANLQQARIHITLK